MTPPPLTAEQLARRWGALLLVLLLVAPSRPATGPAPITPAVTGYESGVSAAPADRSRTPRATVEPVDPALASRAVTQTSALRPTSRPGPITGTASWFRSPANVSAAGPELRRALGKHWRGMLVHVCLVRGPCGSGDGVITRLGDWCLCTHRLIDLDDDAFARLAPLSTGLVRVRVAGVVALPETDTE